MIYGHGDDLHQLHRPLQANFSSNANPQADLSALQAHLCRRMDCIAHYPEPAPRSLEALIAQARGVPSEAVAVTSGATEAIYLIAQAFGGTCTAVVQPAFSEYADACRMHGHRLSALYRLPASDGPEGGRLPSQLRMLWLGCPANPTGTVIPKATLLSLIDRHPQVCFVVDLSYEAFTLCPLLTPAEAVERHNILLVHSLTKRYAIPGLRIGYVTGNPGLLSRVRSRAMPWSVNALAIEAGTFLVGQGQIDKLPQLSVYLDETQRFRTVLQQLGGIDVWPTDAHFFLCCLRVGRASALRDYLLNEHGLLIRDASNFDGLDSRFLRLSTQLPAHNDALVSAMKDFLSLP